MEPSYEDATKKMVELADRLGGHIDKLKTANDSLREKALAVLEALREMVGVTVPTPNLCGVCFTRAKTHAFTPCGHIHCEPCARRGNNRRRCHVCRARVEDLIRVYFN